MKQFFKGFVTILLCLCMAFAAIACGGSGDPGTVTPPDDPDKPGPVDPTPGEKVVATIDFYTTVNIIEQRALQAAADAYSDLQYNKGNDITINLSNSTDPDAYTQNIRNMMTGSITNPTIAVTSVIPEYYGTDKIVDLTAYLGDPNPYIEGNTAWRDAMEPDAYRAQRSGAYLTIPGISYSSNYVTVFYNKTAMKQVMGNDPAVGEDGTIDQSQITWDWMINALQKAKDSNLNFKNPLGVSTSAQSCGEDGFNVLSSILNMYLDQYFRDFIDEVHSEEGDYSYIERIDKDWVYDPDNAVLDLTGNYTYNMNKVVNSFFNKEDYAPTSARYAEMMENLYDLMQYADQEASYNDVFNRFNETTIIFENKGSGSYSDMKLFYVETLGYVRTYRDAFKTTDAGGVTTYPSSEQIESELGWFLLPAMNSSLEGVADNIRPTGGPNENFGILSTGNTAKDEIAIDFLRYLYSPAGQQQIYAIYKSENNAPIVMRQLIKDVTVPAEIDYTDLVSAEGDCSSNPYLQFGKGTGMRTNTIGTTNVYVKTRVAEILSGYFRGNSRAWSTVANSLYDVLKSGFASYAQENNFIYTDYTQVSSVTDGLKNSPFNTTG